MFDSPTNALTHGWRSWLYLLVNFGLGMAYFPLLITGYAVGFSLSIIWIGLPILALMLSATRRVARFDRWLASVFMGMELATYPNDLRFRNANPLHIVGQYLTSGTTWQDATYLFSKFPLGLVSLFMAMMTFPFLLIETMLVVVGINIGAPMSRILRAMASGVSGAIGGLRPAAEFERERYVEVSERANRRTEKAKRRLEQMEDRPDQVYYIDDDGEISSYERR